MFRWPLIKYVPKKTQFKYTRFAGFAAILSILLVIGSFASFATGGFRINPISLMAQTEGSTSDKLAAVAKQAFNLGIDFKGGTLLEISSGEPLDTARISAALGALQLGDIKVQQVDGDPKKAALNFESPDGTKPAEVVDQVKAEMRKIAPDATFPRADVVGPKVSNELFTGGILALMWAIGLMLVYVAFRFEWRYGLGAVLALFHDVILTLGLFSVLRIEFTLTIIAALLTIIGYSMNDTVVVFDRLRENRRKFKKMSLANVIDLSNNETLSRTIITGCTALLALAGFLFIGGEVLFGFALAMIFGVVVGTYSSIYIAAPVIMLWGDGRDKASETEVLPPTETAAAP
jgi:preprotein translocase SecF subunit